MKNAQRFNGSYHRGFVAGQAQARIEVPKEFLDLLKEAEKIGDFDLIEKVEACKEWLKKTRY